MREQCKARKILKEIPNTLELRKGIFRKEQSLLVIFKLCSHLSN